MILTLPGRSGTGFSETAR